MDEVDRRLYLFFFSTADEVTFDVTVDGITALPSLIWLGQLFPVTSTGDGASGGHTSPSTSLATNGGSFPVCHIGPACPWSDGLQMETGGRVTSITTTPRTIIMAFARTRRILRLDRGAVASGVYVAWLVPLLLYQLISWI